MSVKTTTHLNFRGDAREALGFYQSVFGGDQILVTYSDAHSVQDPSEADQIMWGQVSSPDGFSVMAYDVPSNRPWSRGEDPFFVSLRGADPGEIQAYWDKLAEGSKILAPLAPSPWSPLYGMLADKFGVTWVLDVAVEYPSA